MVRQSKVHDSKISGLIMTAGHATTPYAGKVSAKDAEYTKRTQRRRETSPPRNSTGGNGGNRGSTPSPFSPLSPVQNARAAQSCRTPRMSYRRREIPGVSIAEWLSKTERLAAVSSIRLVRQGFHSFLPGRAGRKCRIKISISPPPSGTNPTKATKRRSNQSGCSDPPSNFSATKPATIKAPQEQSISAIDHRRTVTNNLMKRMLAPNAKLTDEKERAHDARIGTLVSPRSSSFGPASGSALCSCQESDFLHPFPKRVEISAQPHFVRLARATRECEAA